MLTMFGRDCKDDYDLLCFGLLVGKPNVTAQIKTRWSNDNLVEPRLMRSKTAARQLRRCLDIPEGFSGFIVFNFHNSHLSGLPRIVEKDGSSKAIQLR